MILSIAFLSKLCSFILQFGQGVVDWIQTCLGIRHPGYDRDEYHYKIHFPGKVDMN